MKNLYFLSLLFITSIPILVSAQANTSKEIRVYYNDYGFSESGDIYGTCEICLVFKEGKVSGTIEQRYGTEGNTFPTQNLKNIERKPDGKITFKYTYYYQDINFKRHEQEVAAEGLLTLKKLTFKINKPDVSEFHLDFIKEIH
ncbi:MAG: hypothetical protein PHQ65_16155 [Bacteroidales bacterium]|nr:hypothetical protein [Bacteroidales bacterium]MDD3666800.1 hypothetical protein [Bacteroidales bacterium]